MKDMCSWQVVSHLFFFLYYNWCRPKNKNGGDFGTRLKYNYVHKWFGCVLQVCFIWSKKRGGGKSSKSWPVFDCGHFRMAVWGRSVKLYVASSPSHSQILFRSHGEKSGSGLGTRLSCTYVFHKLFSCFVLFLLRYQTHRLVFSLSTPNPAVVHLSHSQPIRSVWWVDWIQLWD